MQNLTIELEEIRTRLRLVEVAAKRGYLGAAEAYLDDIEYGVVELRRIIGKMAVLKLSAKNLLHINDPAHEPLEEDL